MRIFLRLKNIIKLERTLVIELKNIIDKIAYSLNTYLNEAQIKPNILLVVAEFISSKL